MLPNLVVIGAMKCATTAVHRYLDDHPDVAMSRPKELNFFFCAADGNARQQATADAEWRTGLWHRGIDWYAEQFPDEAPVRGEASPGYTSPAHPEVPARMAAVIPDARLVYLVRDPVRRAVSQYHHHRADGTETRPLAQALLDPASQYIARGRYFERLEPFLCHFPADRILVVTQEDLEDDCRATVAALYRYAGVQSSWAQRLAGPEVTGSDAAGRRSARPETADVDPELHAQLATAFAEDAARLRSWSGREFARWSV